MSPTQIDEVCERLKHHYHASVAKGINRKVLHGVQWEITWKDKRVSAFTLDEDVHGMHAEQVFELLKAKI